MWPSRSITGDGTYHIGERVECSSDSLGAWIEARVKHVHADGTIDLDWGWAYRKRVDPLRIHPLSVSPQSNRDKLNGQRKKVNPLASSGGGGRPWAAQ